MCTCKTSEHSIPGNFSPKLELGEDALKNCLKEKKKATIINININVGSVTRPLPFSSLCQESNIYMATCPGTGFVKINHQTMVRKTPIL